MNECVCECVRDCFREKGTSSWRARETELVVVSMATILVGLTPNLYVRMSVA